MSFRVTMSQSAGKRKRDFSKAFESHEQSTSPSASTRMHTRSAAIPIPACLTSAPSLPLDQILDEGALGRLSNNDHQTPVDKVSSTGSGADGHADRLRIWAGLDKLPYAAGAAFDDHGAEHNLCHPDTRVEVLQQIQEWAQQPDGKHIFWLTGLAGTGKSTISRTVAEQLASQTMPGSVVLGASFFFKRGAGDRGSSIRFFPTIVRQLAEKIPQLESLIVEVVEQEPRICGKMLGEQFKKLLYQPLQRISSSPNEHLLVIVVDALDECDDTDDIQTILKLWSRLPEITSVCLKLFVTSRPEQPIQLGFKDMAGGVHRDMVLHEIPRPIIEDDISAFLRDSFLRIRDNYNKRGPVNSLDEHWPGEETLRYLIKKTVPLFIAAATVCRFVGDSIRAPPKQLMAFLNSGSAGDLSQLANTYLPVLNQIPITEHNLHDREQLFKEFKMIIGSIIVLADPISITSLASLLQLDVDDVEAHLRYLHSVIQIPVNSQKPVRIFHLSFAEFLLDDTAIPQHCWTIDGPGTHKLLLERCLQLLSGPDGLRENVCDLPYPGFRRQSIGSGQIKRCLAPHVQYACHYWVYHAQRTGSQIADYDIVHDFLAKHILHWLEALSLIGRVASVVSFVDDLQDTMAPGRGPLWTLLEDVRRFVLAYRRIIDLAPLQVYPCATVLTPQNSEVRMLHSQPPAWICQGPIVPTAWSLELQRLEGHTNTVRSVAFSPDSTLVASGSHDKTVRLWQVQTGQEVQKLEGHTDGITSVAFSPDGTLVASGSDDETVRLWQVQTGQQVQKLEGHTRYVASVAFSPDGTLVVSASFDMTVRLWQVQTGQEVQKLEGHTHWVMSVAFSPDGTLVASGSYDETVRLWQVQTGQEVQKLEGHTKYVVSVAFSPDGTLVASGSDDKTVRLWQVQTGQQVQKLEGHTHWVMPVAFSPDGTLVASGSYDMTVRLWQVQTGQQVQKLEGHTEYVASVAFSLDGALVASASHDKTVRLWQVQTGQQVQKLEGHTDGVESVAFSPDGTLVASASRDKTVRLWQVQTGQQVQKLEGHTDVVVSMTFSPENAQVVSRCANGTGWLWDVQTGQKLPKFDVTHAGQVSSAGDGTDTLSNSETIHLGREPDGGRDAGVIANQRSDILGGIKVKSDWIQYKGLDVLWLPQEYRTRVSAMSGNTIALGRRLGTVSIMGLDPTALERAYAAIQKKGKETPKIHYSRLEKPEESSRSD